jgi:hypothetical protein
MESTTNDLPRTRQPILLVPIRWRSSGCIATQDLDHRTEDQHDERAEQDQPQKPAAAVPHG